MPIYRVKAVTTTEWHFCVEAETKESANEFIEFNFGELCIPDFSGSDEDEWTLTKMSEDEVGTGQYINRREEDGGDYEYDQK
jgi:hypothetical protein